MPLFLRFPRKSLLASRIKEKFVKLCPQCGKPLAPSLTEGRARKVCTDSRCGYVFWNNPFSEKNQTIVAYHVRAAGTLVPGEEIAEVKVLPPEKGRPWDAGMGPAV